MRKLLLGCDSIGKAVSTKKQIPFEFSRHISTVQDTVFHSMLQRPKIQELNQTLNHAEPRETYNASVSISPGPSYKGCQAACGWGEMAGGG